MTTADKPCHILIAVGFAFVTSFTAAHPLEDAAEKATALCAQFEDAESVEHCGTGMGGRSPERTAARMAVKSVFMERTAFMRECQAKQPFEDCAYQAEWLIGSGMARLHAPVQHIDATSSALRRSDKRR
jgi:hypothetical protein